MAEQINNLSIDAVKLIAEILDGEWHFMYPNLHKSGVIYELKHARIVEYSYFTPFFDAGYQIMRIRLHKRLRRHWVKKEESELWSAK